MIKKLWNWIFGGCQHKWVIIEYGTLTVTSDIFGRSEGKRYTLQCEHCGIIKKKDIV